MRETHRLKVQEVLLQDRRPLTHQNLHHLLPQTSTIHQNAQIKRNHMLRNQRISTTRNNGINTNDKHSSTSRRTKRISLVSESVVRFLLSFMTGGLPEKFAANFIDEVIADYEEEMKDYRIYGGDEPVADWGTENEFYAKCEEAFGDQNKKANAEHQLALLRQGNKTAEEYFQEFDQLARTAGYHKNHDDVLIKYLNEQVKSSIIDKIYSIGRLPNDTQNGRKPSSTLTGWNDDEPNKRSSSQRNISNPRQEILHLLAPPQKKGQRPLHKRLIEFQKSNSTSQEQKACASDAENPDT
jgi:hypothetical protein